MYLLHFLRLQQTMEQSRFTGLLIYLIFTLVFFFKTILYFFKMVFDIFAFFGIYVVLLVFADSQLYATLTERCMIVF